LLRRYQEQQSAWLKWHPLPWSADVENEYRSRFSRRLEEWLDAGYGACILRRKRCAQEIALSLRHFDGTRVAMISFVIMPNHVHAVFALLSGCTLESIVHSWKRQSAVRINRVVGRTGTVWQRDYFDRLVRSEKHFARCVRYIRGNPNKARLIPGEYIVYESDAARAVGGAV
jgi:REP element-mobilizing transposase RayT